MSNSGLNTTNTSLSTKAKVLPNLSGLSEMVEAGMQLSQSQYELPHSNKVKTEYQVITILSEEQTEELGNTTIQQKARTC